MIYKTGNNIVENKIVTYYPVLVVEFNQFKMVYYIKKDSLYSIRNYFFTTSYNDTDNIMGTVSESTAISLIDEFKANPNYENLIKNFVEAVKDYNNPFPSVNESQYLDHYFSIVRKEHLITNNLLANKHRISLN